LLHPQVFADEVPEHLLKPQLPLQFPQPDSWLQIQFPPFAAPQLGEPQLEVWVHSLLQSEQVRVACLL
jgi:hypothetical protein